MAKKKGTRTTYVVHLSAKDKADMDARNESAKAWKRMKARKGWAWFFCIFFTFCGFTLITSSFTSALLVMVAGIVLCPKIEIKTYVRVIFFVASFLLASVFMKPTENQTNDTTNTEAPAVTTIAE